jgi:hypothetical protein
MLSNDDNSLGVFEALLTLTNLTSDSEDCIQAVIRDKGLVAIQNLQLHPHDMIQRAASELLCNLLPHPQVLEIYKNQSFERNMKIWGAFAQSEDFQMQRAALGALAILSNEPIFVQEMFNYIEHEAFLLFAADKNEELQHRGVYILLNLLKDKKIAETLVEKGAALILINIINTSKNGTIQKYALQAVQQLEQHNLIPSQETK